MTAQQQLGPMRPGRGGRLLYKIPLMVLFFALWVGIPAWLVVRHPDSGPQPAQPSALAYLPA